MTNFSKSTLDFLLLISKHLSSRKECKSYAYCVEITENSIKFSPHIELYPDIHKKQKSDLEPIVLHILKYHMPMLIPESGLEKSEYGSYKINEDILIPGTYLYSPSIDNKARKWFRSISVESL